MTTPTAAASRPGTLPEGYRLAHAFILTGPRTLIWMNVVGLLILAVALSVVLAVRQLDDLLGRPLALAGTGLPQSLPAWVYLLLAVPVLILHEALHGLAIRLLGYRPRFGAKPLKFVLYTTADVYFTRGQYLAVTLAPIAGITLLGLLGMLLLPVGIAPWIGVLAAMNAAASIGDLWMAAVIASYPDHACFHDDADGMSVYLP